MSKKNKVRYILTDNIKKIEHKAASRWVSGTGSDAVFEQDSTGWYGVFESCPASIYLGEDEPSLKIGPVRMIIEQDA